MLEVAKDYVCRVMGFIHPRVQVHRERPRVAVGANKRKQRMKDKASASCFKQCVAENEREWSLLAMDARRRQNPLTTTPFQ